jgi:hypothetical protein
MKQGWIGVVAGLAVGTVAVFMTQRGTTEQGPHKPTAAEGSAAIAACDPGGPTLAAAYDKVAAPVHTYLTSEPAKALEAARGQVANVLEGRLQACSRALQLNRSIGSADDPRLVPYIAHLRAALARLSALITTLQSPQADDAPQKLQALDAAVH